jgi:hypothetical protein
MSDSEYLKHLDPVASLDVQALKHAEVSYGNSWKKRGGVGAFMMLARKWDRIEQKVSTRISSSPHLDAEVHADRWDIFDHLAHDHRAEGLIDDIRDLRRYLLLVEAEMVARGAESASTVSRDNQEG